MKYVWSFIFLLNSLFFPSLVYGVSSSQLENAALSVWKISTEGKRESVRSTGFFIGPNHFVATLAFLEAAIAKTSLDLSIALSQGENGFVLKIKNLVLVSPLHNLAVFETDQSVTNYLKFAENPPEPGNDLFLITYPSITVIGEPGENQLLTTRPRKVIEYLRFFHEDGNDNRHYFLPAASELYGNNISGPVFNEQGHTVDFLSPTLPQFITPVFKEQGQITTLVPSDIYIYNDYTSGPVFNEQGQFVGVASSASLDFFNDVLTLARVSHLKEVMKQIRRD